MIDLNVRILDRSYYPVDCLLTDAERENLLRACNEGLCTLNGDTAPVTITVRQLLLLLRKTAL